MFSLPYFDAEPEQFTKRVPAKFSGPVCHATAPIFQFLTAHIFEFATARVAFAFAVKIQFYSASRRAV